MFVIFRRPSDYSPNPPGRYPYSVSLDYNNGVVPDGSLLAPDFVQTAGQRKAYIVNTIKVGTLSPVRTSLQSILGATHALYDVDNINGCKKVNVSFLLL